MSGPGPRLGRVLLQPRRGCRAGNCWAVARGWDPGELAALRATALLTLLSLRDRRAGTARNLKAVRRAGIRSDLRSGAGRRVGRDGFPSSGFTSLPRSLPPHCRRRTRRLVRRPPRQTSSVPRTTRDGERPSPFARDSKRSAASDSVLAACSCTLDACWYAAGVHYADHPPVPETVGIGGKPPGVDGVGRRWARDDPSGAFGPIRAVPSLEGLLLYLRRLDLHPSTASGPRRVRAIPRPANAPPRSLTSPGSHSTLLRSVIISPRLRVPLGMCICERRALLERDAVRLSTDASCAATTRS